MHIEPGLVDTAKLAIGYATAAGVIGLTLHSTVSEVLKGNVGRLAVGTLATLVVTLLSFEALPHPTVGVSEVHLILGATMLLLFGLAPAALGMAGGLLLQGFLFEPADIAQYGMNVTTLLASLFATAAVANRLIAPNTRYVDIPYRQLVKLSLLFQGSIVAWVVFWVALGQGVSVATLQSLASFGSAYVAVIATEVLISLGLLAALRRSSVASLRGFLNPRLFHAQAV